MADISSRLSNTMPFSIMDMALNQGSKVNYWIFCSFFSTVECVQRHVPTLRYNDLLSFAYLRIYIPSAIFFTSVHLSYFDERKFKTEKKFDFKWKAVEETEQLKKKHCGQKWLMEIRDVALVDHFFDSYLLIGDLLLKVKSDWYKLAWNSISEWWNGPRLVKWPAKAGSGSNSKET